MRKLLNLFRWKRQRLEKDLDRELRYHFERRVADRINAGLSEAESRRQAQIELGGVAQVQEEVRDTWIWGWLDDLARDIRFAFRSLGNSWLFALGAGSVLALGIGANTAIFSVVNTVLLQPLAYPDAGRIVSLEMLHTNTGRTSPEVSGGDFQDWQKQSSSFEAMAYCLGEDDVATIVNGRAEFANFRLVSPDFFAVFGLPASVGRLLPRTEQTSTAVVSREWAEAHFGSAEAAIGKSISVYKLALEIVGVAAPGFHYPEATNIWAPAGRTNLNRGPHPYQVIGRLKPGTELASARSEMQTIGARLAYQYFEDRFTNVTLTPLKEHLTGNVRLTLWLLMGAVSLVLLIACANIANLQLARSAARTHEIAVRAALGAGRGRVVRQLLTENFVLTGLAALGGVLLAHGIVRGLLRLSPVDLPRVEDVRIDGTALLFALGLMLVSTFAAGLLPALDASRRNTSDALKQGGSKGAIASGSGRLRSALAVTEIALSVMLLAAAGLLLRSFEALHQVDLRFTTQHVLAAYTQYVVTNRKEAQDRIAFYRDLLRRVRAMPGVEAASGAAFLPLGKEPRPRIEYFMEGQPEPPPGERPKCEYQAITPDYFKTLKIPLKQGRDFDERDTIGRTRVAIINDSLARAAFPHESPIGHRIRIQRGPQWLEIVGVVAGARWRDPSQPPPPELFEASFQGAGGSLSLFVRTARNDAGLGEALRRVLQDMNPSVPIHFETMDEMFSEALAYPRFRTELIGAFAGIAALLAALGIFSVLAYLVGQRTRELAVRRAVGAQVSDLIRLIAGQGLRLVLVGLVLGVVGALAAARLLAGVLFEISPWDLGAYAGATAVLGITAML
ncbi:MAG TPA: ABC transporter permease, partial [Bryobacteraceae bacterium]